MILRVAAPLLAATIFGPLCAPSAPPAPPPADPPSQTPAEPFNGCFSVRESESARTDVMLTEFEAAVGQPVTSEGVRDLAHRLGTRAEPGLRYAWAHDRGVTLVIDEYQQIEAIDLHGRAQGVEPYQGELPQGLRYTHTLADVEQRLGPPDGCNRDGRCAWYESGLEVVFGYKTCVSTVRLRRPLAKNTAMVQHLALEPKRQHGADGFAIDLWYALNLDVAAVVTVVLKDEHGDVPAVVKEYGEMGHDGRLSWTFEHEPGLASNGLGQFIGFHEVVLKPGPLTLRPQVLVEPVATPEQSSRTVPVTWVPPAPPSLDVEMPACQWLRFGVRRTAVEPRDYGGFDGAEFPDLQWTLTLGGRQLHRSKERAGALKATWTGRTPWFRACRNDSLRLAVDDVDVLKRDRVGTLALPVDELVALGRAPKPLTFESVRTLVLSRVEKRRDGPPPR